MPTIDVVNDRLVFPLLSICKLHRAYNSLGTIVVIEEFTLHLVLIFNYLGHKVFIPIKKVPLERTNKLFD